MICVVLVFRATTFESGPHFVCTNAKQAIYSAKPTCSVLVNKVNTDRWETQNESETVSLCSRRIGEKAI